MSVTRRPLPVTTVTGPLASFRFCLVQFFTRERISVDLPETKASGVGRERARVSGRPPAQPATWAACASWQCATAPWLRVEAAQSQPGAVRAQCRGGARARMAAIHPCRWPRPMPLDPCWRGGQAAHPRRRVQRQQPRWAVGSPPRWSGPAGSRGTAVPASRARGVLGAASTWGQTQP
eukprot:scaffold27748_cov112-Isochrysis_galbana.AAC.1